MAGKPQDTASSIGYLPADTCAWPCMHAPRSTLHTYPTPPPGLIYMLWHGEVQLDGLKLDRTTLGGKARRGPFPLDMYTT